MWRCLLRQSKHGQRAFNSTQTSSRGGTSWRMISLPQCLGLMSGRCSADKGYVRTDIVVNSDKSLGDFLPDEPLPDGEHKTVDAVAVTDVVSPC